MTSSRSSSQSQAASRTHRIRNLRRAHIYIDQLELQEWPDWAQNFARRLIVEDLQVAHTLNNAEQNSEDVALARAAEQVQKYHRNLRRLTASVEPYWMSFSQNILFSSLIEEPGFSTCQDQVWNEPVDIIEGDLAPLSVPKPDLAFGLAVSDSVSHRYGQIDDSWQGLDEADLTYLQIQAKIHPYPSPAIPDLAFPCVVYECKSDTQPIFYAENQVAGASAKALRMQESLRTAAGETNGELPIVAVCSQGTLWKVFLTFRANTQPESSIVGTVIAHQLDQILKNVLLS